VWLPVQDALDVGESRCREAYWAANSSSDMSSPWNIVKLYAVRPSGSATAGVGKTAIASLAGPANMSMTPLAGSALIAKKNSPVPLPSVCGPGRRRSGGIRGADALARPRRLPVPTAKGKRRTKDSVRQRILNPTIARAAELADERELPQAFPETLGTHAGKRTAPSHLIQAGYDISWMMDGPARPRRRAPDDGGVTASRAAAARTRACASWCGRPSSRR
jgi:hypothetical protein